MKTIGTVVLLMLVVAGVAAGGSFAQAGPAMSVALAQCHASEGSSRCRPLTERLAMMLEEGADFANGYGSVGANEVGQAATPEHGLTEHVGAVLYGLAELVVREVYNHFLQGGGLPLVLDTPADSRFFDPAR
jgi:hypothetical protein